MPVFGALAIAAALTSAAASAQEAVEARIGSVFEIVPENRLDLAIPLSRRVLTERAGDESGSGALFYAPPEVPALPPASDGSSQAVTEASEPADDGLEEGSAEDLARVPRPRPLLPEADAAIAIDLVAGAALPVPAEPRLAELPPQLPIPAGSVNVAFADDAGDTAGGAVSAEPAGPTEAVVATTEVATAGPARQVPPDGAADLTASGECLAPGAFADGDGDFGRNAELLENAGFCIEEDKFNERRRPWTIQIVASGRPGPLWVVMHDDEDVAFDNALRALQSYGGRLVAVETGGDRNQDGVDPNRNFSTAGIGCAKLGDDATPEFTATFKRLFEPTQPIIALHNNPDGPIPTGGVGHVTMESPPRGMRTIAAEGSGDLSDDHTLVLLTAVEPVPSGIEARGEELAAKGVNVIIEPVRAGGGDCSLSNYAVLSGHPTYLNVTVDQDAANQQGRIVDIIMGNFDGVAAAL